MFEEAGEQGSEVGGCCIMEEWWEGGKIWGKGWSSSKLDFHFCWH